MTERVSLEQLFADSEPVRPQRRRRRPLVRDTVLALLIGGAAYAVLRVFGFVVPFPVLAGTAMAVLLLRRALAGVPVDEPPAALYSPVWGVLDEESARFGPVDGVARAVQRWESRFGWTERDQVRFTTAVRPRLRDLADERLRQRHGVTLRSDPARARELLGDPLWTFLHDPVRRPPGPREVATIVGEMEKI